MAPMIDRPETTRRVVLETGNETLLQTGYPPALVRKAPISPDIDQDFFANNWVLIVDDDPMAVDEISMYLRNKGFTCKTAFDGISAFDIIVQTPEISLVVTDIRMPSLSGIQMVQQIREEFGPERHLEVIIMTGHGGRTEAIEALQAGAIDFIAKPVSLKHLLHSAYKAMKIIGYRQTEAEYKAALESALAKEKKLSDMQRDFISMVSHEYRTPLAIIDGAAQFLLRHNDSLDESAILDRAQNIRRSVRRMISLLEETLNSSRLDAGELEVIPGAVNIKTLLEEIGKRPLGPPHSHKISIDAKELPDEITADSHLLDLLFTNLVGNAVKYSPDANLVEIEGWTENDFAVVTVRDHGIGIPSDELPRIFEKFYRASTTRTYEGTGLGLSFAKKITELHGGDISMASQLGIGSTVTVCLPL